MQEAAQQLVRNSSNAIPVSEDFAETDSELAGSVALSKSEMEEMANGLRDDLEVALDAPLDALNIRIDGVDVYTVTDVQGLGAECAKFLLGPGGREWSAMSVPLDIAEDRWAILRNDSHTPERQKVTYLEECWHILLGHKLTRIAKVADAFGRTYDSTEEHDAFYLASATMLFSLIPPTGRTSPRSVISPVIARFFFTFLRVYDEAKEVNMVIPALGPSLGVAPSGTWIWISCFS